MTRFLDWQAGALDGEYFMARLKEAEQYIQQYETSLLSRDWICQWDRYGYVSSFCYCHLCKWNHFEPQRMKFVNCYWPLCIAIG
ncbi:hypothetical protein TNCV_633331 [Trichonephila clavipes]|nr:hypothetical protein TNCV_633331 [Trichonephila clavipes]